MAFEGELKFSGNKEECKQDAIMVITGLIEQWDIEREDLFMGSGTTAVACKQLGRQFIGFEISKEYCDIANKRLQQDSLIAFEEKKDKGLNSFIKD